jgi:hypothetical protein
MPVFVVFQLPGAQLNHADIAQLPLVTAFDEYLNCLFAPFFANLAFHESRAYPNQPRMSNTLTINYPTAKDVKLFALQTFSSTDGQILAFLVPHKWQISFFNN